MRIQHNIMAMNAYRNYTNNVSAMKKNLEKLSSGYKINRAGDDAAGLAISEKMRAQITGLQTAQKNAKDGISLIQTAEGALTEVHDMLNRMVTLATQSANGTYDNETDRVQLQKEVDQLREEINRIADSSNFNGIKLLDGTLGLNTDAFELGTADAVAASDGKITLNLSAADAGDDITHLEKTGNTTQVNPTFEIDLTGLEIDTSAGNTTVKFDVFGKTFAVTLNKGADADSNDVWTSSEVAAELMKVIQADSMGVKQSDGTHATTSTANNAVKIGDFVLAMSNSSSPKIQFSYTGIFSGGTFTSGGDFTTDQADAINGALGMGVKVSGVTTGTQLGDLVHATPNVTYAKAKTPSTMAGIDLELDANLVKQGNTLEIDGVKYMFQTEDTAPTAPAGVTVIDVSKGKDDAEKIHMAVDLLSKETVTGKTDGTANDRIWTIGARNSTTIHIEQTVATDTSVTSALDTYDKLTGIIKGQGEETAEKGAGVTIKLKDSSALQEGNVITIGGKKYEYSKDFTDLDSLKSLLSSDYDVEINSNGDTLTIRDTDASKAAPTVLGKGLTLQIGDTAESFNQLNVLVNDTHCSSLGIAGINIANQDGAAAAVDKIKSAINFVSDVRGTLGATQNRLDHTINNLSVMTENIQDAESTIRDTDVAEEMMAYTKNNILIQSAQAMLAQANQVPQGVLQLLQ